MQQLIDFKNKEVKFVRIFQDLKKNTPRFAKLQPKRLLVTLSIDVKKIYFMIKVVFFQKNQLGIGPHVRKKREMSQKLDFRTLIIEI